MHDLTDATLRHIDQVINQDVEMQASRLSHKATPMHEWHGFQHSAAEEMFNLVVDTNVLLHQLDALQQFVVDIEHHLPFTLQIIVPGVVISELDRCVYSAIYIY